MRETREERERRTLHAKKERGNISITGENQNKRREKRGTIHPTVVAWKGRGERQLPRESSLSKITGLILEGGGSGVEDRKVV